METPTSTRELIGDEKAEDTREPRRFEREPTSSVAATAASRDTTERSGTAGFAAEANTNADDAPELLPRDQNEGFQRRWEQIQTGFVDEPRQTVEQADELVAEVMKRLAEGFAAERERLEGQWGRGEDVSTEDLRIALQRYRGFFQRLLSA
jgi:predicted lipid-binding transport protein (Tim44 family)